MIEGVVEKTLPKAVNDTENCNYGCQKENLATFKFQKKSFVIYLFFNKIALINIYLITRLPDQGGVVDVDDFIRSYEGPILLSDKRRSELR